MGIAIPAATGTRRVWLRVGTLLDGGDGQPLRDAHVVYDRRAILYVGEKEPPAELVKERGPAKQGPGRPDVELPEWSLLPGLIDAHTHLFLEGGELDAEKRAAYLQQPPAQLLELALGRLEKLVRLGIAGVRDAGDKDGVGLALSRLCASAERPLMPYVDSPGAAIHHRGRYGAFMAEAVEEFASPRECVEARVRAGADRIKLIATGIINFRVGTVTSEPQMAAGEIAEMVATAKSRGRQTLAHASGDAGIENAIEGGVDSVEHGFFVREDQLARMRDRGIAWAPTFVPVRKQVEQAERMGWDGATVGKMERILEGHAASLQRAQALGVTILASSDAGSYGVAHGLGLLQELELMEASGLRATAVMHAATGAPAERLAFREKIGRVGAGFRSRFIVTRHAPLEGVANLRKPRVVIFDGEVFEAGEDAETVGL